MAVDSGGSPCLAGSSCLSSAGWPRTAGAAEAGPKKAGRPSWIYKLLWDTVGGTAHTTGHARGEPRPPTRVEGDTGGGPPDYRRGPSARSRDRGSREILEGGTGIPEGGHRNTGGALFQWFIQGRVCLLCRYCRWTDRLGLNR